MIYSLKNPIKNYSWGSRIAICNHFGIGNPSLEPQAEVWMGAHPCGSSVISQEGAEINLCDAIANNPDYWLGKHAERYAASLPFLMKILAAEQPLSVQVHPSKLAAEQGFRLENKKGVPLDAANRNYKDTNHKPELVYAVTPFLAMNGFREFEQIILNFDSLKLFSLENMFQPFKNDPSPLTLSKFFTTILELEGEAKTRVINDLLNSIEAVDENNFAYQAATLISHFNHLYPDDLGLFAPLFLNIIELQPGEAMFLSAETPHAYIHGLAIEIMANSDNVLRVGLTKKHTDVDELVKNTLFQPISFKKLISKPEIDKTEHKIYPISVEDFNFDVLYPHNTMSFTTLSPEILLCLSEKVTIMTDKERKTLHKGDSVVLPASLGIYRLFGKGVVARAYS